VKKETKVLLHSNNIWVLAEGMLGPLFAIFAERIGGDILDISWAWATYLIMMGILVITMGDISDKKGFSKEKMMVWGYSLNAIFTFCYLFVQNPTQLFVVQGGLGVAAAFTIPTWNALYAKYEDKRHGGFVWGLATGEAQIVGGLAIIIGGFIVNSFSFTALFIVMGVIQTAAAIYQSQILFITKRTK